MQLEADGMRFAIAIPMASAALRPRATIPPRPCAWSRRADCSGGSR